MWGSPGLALKRQGWQLIALIVLAYHAALAGTAGIDLISTETATVTYAPPSTVVEDVLRYIYENGTVVQIAEICTDNTKTTCITNVTTSYPDLGTCAFRYYRVRLFFQGTDTTMIGSVTEFLLWLNGEVLEPAESTTDVPSNETYSLPRYAIDGNLETDFINLDLSNLIVSFAYNVLADEACIALGRKPSTGVAWALDGAKAVTGPWYARVNRTDIEADVGYQQCVVLPQNDQPELCQVEVQVTYPATVPADWFLIGETPVRCMELGACLYNGTCADWNTGPLCHQCAATSGGVNGTRFREGDKCEVCPDYIYPVLKSVVFVLVYLVLLIFLIVQQYKLSVKPWRLVQALELTELLDIEEEVFPPLYATAIVRLLLEHQVFCGWAWEEAGVFHCLPEGARPLGLMIMMDWFATMQVGCVFPSWEIPNQLIASHLFVPGASLVVFFATYFRVSMKYCGDCEDLYVGCAPLRCLRITCRIINNVLGGCCTKCWGYLDFAPPEDDPDGGRGEDASDDGRYDLPQEKTRKPQPVPEKGDDWHKGPPSAVTCALGAVVILNFLQLPLLTNAFLIHLDCVNLTGSDKPVLRADLRIQCDGLEYSGRATASTLGIVLWLLAMPLYCASVVRGRGEKDGSWVGTMNTKQSAFSFMVAGLRPNYWWLGLEKMMLKELMAILMLFVRLDGPPRGHGFGSEPGILVFFGSIVLGIHIYMDPYEPEHSWLMLMEKLSWIAFIAAPLTRLLFGMEADSASYLGRSYIGYHIQEAETWIQWVLIVLCILLYISVPVCAAMACLQDEVWFLQFEPPKVKLQIAERVHVQMPEAESHRTWLADTLAMLFRQAFWGDRAELTPGRTVAPGAVLESALIMMAKDAAKESGLELTRVNEIEVERDMFHKTLDKLVNGVEQERIYEHRSVLEPGGFAEATLGGGRGGKKKPKNRFGSGSSGDEPVQPIVGGTTAGYDTGVYTDAEKKVIAFSFAVECVELKSLGFRAGEGSESNSLRTGVRQALERGIAAAAACTETDVTVAIHPVGMDRALVLAQVYAQGTPAEEDTKLRIREEWLRNTLGTREGRSRWGRAVESDLMRVGCVSAAGGRLQVRFTRGSRPVRMQESFAKATAEATVAAASAAAATDNRPEPTLLGRLGQGGLDAEEEEMWDVQPSRAGNSPTSNRAKSHANAQARAVNARGAERVNERLYGNDDGQGSEASGQEPPLASTRSRPPSAPPASRRRGGRDEVPGSNDTRERSRRRVRQMGATSADGGRGRQRNSEPFAWQMV